MTKVCNDCSLNEIKTIPYAVHESAMARSERSAKRLWILIILLVLLFVGTNIAWFVYESQYEVIETTETYEADATDGGNAIINGDGSVEING